MRVAYLAFLCLLVSVSCHKEIIQGSGIKTGKSTVSAAEEDTSYYNYHLARLSVVTEGNAPIESKEEYVPCTVNLYGDGHFADRALTGGIRGRGNSTWYWYPKKPYRIKLEDGSRMMGMKKNKDWVLLADFRDVTHLMNNVAFTMAHELGLPYANHSRYVKLKINGDDIGLYMITEQVEEGKHRVQLDSLQGILLALDLNDGPSESPNATDNFWSKVFGTACAVKYPKDVDATRKEQVRSSYAALEQVIDQRDWKGIQRLLDVESMINYILIQEIIGNGEIDNNPSMRSGYIHRYDVNSKWVMGPFWDADAGFGYDAADMFNNNGMCHTFFIHNPLVFGTEPYLHKGAMNATASDLFCRLFGIPEFVQMLKEHWNSRQVALLDTVLLQIDKTEEAIAAAADADMALWDISKFQHAEEVAKMKTWLRERFAYLNQVINNYPEIKY